MINYHAVDRFGVPEGMFGALDDDFYGAVGRIANLTALLEVRLITIHQTLAGLEQDEQTNLPGSDLCSYSKDLVQELVASGELSKHRSELITQFLKSAAELLEARHSYIHNAWSTKGNGVIYGWRPGRHGKLTGTRREAGIAKTRLELWYSADATTTSLSDAQTTVLKLVELNRSWPMVHAACQRSPRWTTNS